MSNTLNMVLYGDEAKKIIKQLGLTGTIGESKTVEMTVKVSVRSAAGRSKIGLEFNL